MRQRREVEPGEAGRRLALRVACPHGVWQHLHTRARARAHVYAWVWVGEEEWTAPVMSRFTFFARRPFHPARLHKLLKRGLDEREGVFA